MAKEKENKNNSGAAEQGTEVIDNISTIVRNDGKATVDLAKQVTSELQKAKDDRLKEEIKNRVLKAEFRRKTKYLQLRKRRDEAKITKKFLEQAEILQYQMSGFPLDEEHIKKMGGTNGKLELEVITGFKDGEPIKEKKTFELKKGEDVWVPGSITTPEFDLMCDKLEREESAEKVKLEKQYDLDKENLESQYPGYFSYSWRW